MMIPVSAASEGYNCIAAKQNTLYNSNDEIVIPDSDNETEGNRQGEACLTVTFGSWFVNYPYVFFSGTIYLTLSNGTTTWFPVAEQTTGNFPVTGVSSVRFVGSATNWHSSYGTYDPSIYQSASVDFTMYMFMMPGQTDDSSQNQ